ncbi:hypothetical protein ANN_13097 [Periplaneta americana]|uniref:Uncharacterized protein n=1 Tax=Periplaneta americana TaxID=6978 RepID=A0ABQ8TKG2_PERAM|nr:hypothetical protein ANN_13097 [Periplaneta americana]
MDEIEVAVCSDDGDDYDDEYDNGDEGDETAKMTMTAKIMITKMIIMTKIETDGALREDGNETPGSLKAIKSLVYSSPVDNEGTLHQRILQGCQTVRTMPGIWEHVRISMRQRAAACIQAGGGGEHLLVGDVCNEGEKIWPPNPIISWRSCLMSDALLVSLVESRLVFGKLTKQHLLKKNLFPLKH